MEPMIWMIMVTGLLMSTTLVLSCHHWVLIWLGLELSTMSIIPIIIKTHHPRATEAATKYFLVQAAGAALILLEGTLNTWQTGQWSILQSPPLSTTIMTIAIMLKLGLAPMHFWYPDVLQGTPLTTALAIATWQKLAPLSILFLISQTPSPNMLILGLLSALIGGWMGLNQTQTRKLLAFSSIAHMGWLVTALTLSPALATLTLLTYIFMTTTMFLYFSLMATKTLSDLSTAHTCYPALTAPMMLSMMSLGGLPPLSGFLPKWMILSALVMKTLPLLATTLALASLPSLYFYTRMTYVSALTIPPSPLGTKHKWRMKPHLPLNLAMFSAIATMLLPLTPVLTYTL
uniref:NADH-ubiquinone oxidoreductase chain 2 n=1 Tax=Lygodactylus bivittis TaxID=301840 RepID=J7G5Y2_9SAUR|nr:NADH dehydrogenase subunit 2 [Lygodactylus bivittis]